MMHALKDCGLEPKFDQIYYIIYLHFAAAFKIITRSEIVYLEQFILTNPVLASQEVHRSMQSAPNLCTGRPPIEFDNNRCCIITIFTS